MQQGYPREDYFMISAIFEGHVFYCSYAALTFQSEFSFIFTQLS